MGGIVAGRLVPNLTNNESFEAYEDDVPLQASATPVGIFHQERDALCQMADADAFEGLTTVTLPGNSKGDGEGGDDGGDASGYGEG